ncbi:MAG: 4'-phosphopantetheinyl transferase superfamily protein [Lachnospiraceae bacterium]|nr:4'-phosphopantetheinyl transferase superfamily protein [Lachnospiraceae bacterium]
MIRIYTSRTDELKDENRFNESYMQAAGYRKKKTDRLKGMEDKMRSLAAEDLLRKACKECNVVYDGRVETDANGKPRIMGAAGIDHNISHSGNRVLLVMADHEVGCDVEAVGRCSLKIARRFFGGEELEGIEQLSGEERDIYLTKLWVLKESFIKAVGKGLAYPIDKAVFKIDDNKVVLCDAPGVAADDYRFRLWEEEGYCYAVAEHIGNA